MSNGGKRSLSVKSGGNEKTKESHLADENEVPETAPEAEEDKSNVTTAAFIPPQISTPPPWPEWSDQYINNETWETDDKLPFVESFSPTKVLNITGNYNWTRPAEFIPNAPAVVKLNCHVLDLISPNEHLCEKFELIRYILSEISELYEYGLQHKSMECEGEGVAYVPNHEEEDKRWTPWSHIYSCCKAGVRGEKPAYNPAGKYYVRLYFMGAWRRIAVDDRIPVYPSGLSGLPLTEANELWPLLLTKALLKIAAVTWNELDGKNFSVISALTGWVFEWVDSLETVNEDELWMDLSNTLPKYVDPKRIPSCYTLLKPSIKKKLLPEEGNDTWWMPQYNPKTYKTDDEAHFKDYELEPLQQHDLTAFMGIQWKRTELATTARRFSRASGQTEMTEMADDDHSNLPLEADHATAKAKLMSKKSRRFKKGEKPLPHMASNTEIKKKEHHNKKNKQQDKSKKKHDHENNDKLEDERLQSKDKLHEDHEKEEVRKPTIASPTPAKHWDKIKNLVLGKSDDHLNPRHSKSVPETLIDPSTREHGEEMEHKLEEYREAHAKWIPSVAEILYGVQKFSGIDHRKMVQNWEHICGKDSPIALVVILKSFPKAEVSSEADVPVIPSFLHHPIQLTEIRDTVLHNVVEDRPQTPLWKRFRWKAWAMTKGLIPMEEEHVSVQSNDPIHAIKAKTPFIFKTDWAEEYPEEEDNESVNSPELETDREEDEGDSLDQFLDPFYMDIENLNEDEAGGTPPNPPDVLAGGDGHQNKKHSTASAGSHKQSIQRSSVNKGGTLADDKHIHVPTSPTHVLYESVYGEGESEEEGLDGLIKHDAPPEHAPPKTACGTVWFECADVAKNLAKFCKFYASQSTFGSCYILRREPTLSTPLLDPIFQEIKSNLPQYPEYVDQYRQNTESPNCSIGYDRFKTYSVTDYHLNEKEGIDSGFYLFSDSWTEQDIVFTVEVLQDNLIKAFTQTTTPQAENLPKVPPPSPVIRLGSTFSRKSAKSGAGLEHDPASPVASSLNLILEPWNWKKDNCRCEPLISTFIEDHWITHVRLPPGRNTFRMWLLLHYQSDINPEKSEELMGEDGQVFPKRRRGYITVPFTVRVISQTPIYLGSRVEVQNYMANPPALLLKQAERMANCIWGLIACFGRKRDIYQHSLKELRRSYCPATPEPKMINQFAQGLHNTFEGLFISFLAQLNGGRLDRMLILALQVLFVNPNIGKDFEPVHKHHRKRERPGHISVAGKKTTKWAMMNAALTIQCYYRGWKVRRLLCMRRRNHRHFKKIEYNVRRIGFLLAKETESIFSHSEDGESEGYLAEPESIADKVPLAPPTVLPSPPHWALEFIKYMLEGHPWLINIYPHSHCAAHHIKLQEFQGELPALKEFHRCPFFKNVLLVPKGVEECFCEVDLQVYPSTGIYLKIKNNDTRKCLPLVNNRLFIGVLPKNEKGYSVQCYRWALPGMSLDLTDRAPTNVWKLRVISPHSQIGPSFQKAEEIHRDSLIGEEHGDDGAGAEEEPAEEVDKEEPAKEVDKEAPTENKT